MVPEYRENDHHFMIYERRSRHVPPHIHKDFECLLVTEGALELGVGLEYYHMEKGDFAIVFPDLIHHYQVFRPGENRALKLIATPSMSGTLLGSLERYAPKNPVIPAAQVHPDIRYALARLMEKPPEQYGELIRAAFIQIIFARSIPCFDMVPQEDPGGGDLIYSTVAYIARHYMENVTLTDMARAIGCSPYALSRVFSGTFHTNFNRYLNLTRLEHALTELQYSTKSITEICYESGFESQRTFNRAFRDQFRMTPREFRRNLQGVEHA